MSLIPINDGLKCRPEISMHVLKTDDWVGLHTIWLYG